MIAMKWMLVLWLINGAGTVNSVVSIEFDDGTACEAARPKLIQRITAQEPTAKIMGMCMPKGTYPPAVLPSGEIGPMPAVK